MSIKKEILQRVHIAYFIFCLLAMVILMQTIRIQTVQGDQWRSASTDKTKTISIDAQRGNILSEDGSLLATSLIHFEGRMDLHKSIISDQLFNDKVDSLALMLSKKLTWRSKNTWKRELQDYRKKGGRYFLLSRDLTYMDVTEMKTWPILRRGRFGGGFIIEERYERVNPFKSLANRTIGYLRDNVGIEGYFEENLAGATGQRLVQRVNNNLWIPVHEHDQVVPRNGQDIICTIDVNMQDITERALLRGLLEHKATGGTAVLMEVKTGKIKAISNLELNSKKKYAEIANSAIGKNTEPGSTFKLASMLALYEKQAILGSTLVNIEKGKTKFGNATMKDASWHGKEIVSAKQAFEMSSNVGMAKLVTEHFGRHPEEFINYLHQFNIQKSTGIKIIGEKQPKILSPEDAAWNDKVTLPWLSIGYGVTMSPLQLLTFYNAIANDGVMLQPRLVTEIQRGGLKTETFGIKSRNRICSEASASKMQDLLSSVVENGTAQSIQSEQISMAGKTGTSLIADNNRGYEEKKYQSSFAGFFPADEPEYSCIVVVYDPKGESYYGSAVAAPIFKEIAEMCYANSLDMHESIQQKSILAGANGTAADAYKDDVEIIYSTIGATISKHADSEFIHSKIENDSIQLVAIDKSPDGIPNVMGMGLRDAMYLLENRGLRVRYKGRGKVSEQSLEPGIKIDKGAIIDLTLI